MNQQLSCTSNTVKLFKHLGKLHGIQNGKISPIMLHIAPTNRCQLKCVHCCFQNRDKNAELPYSAFTSAIAQFHALGVTAYEFTGGGDPLLWPHINRAANFLHNMGAHVGLITNGLAVDRVNDWRLFDWVRVSLNTLEYNELDLSPLVGSTDVSFCYIWHEDSAKHLGRIVEFSERYDILCRMTVDCTNSTIEKSLQSAKEELAKYDTKHVFISDFNIDTEQRDVWDCRVHMLKPFLFSDGYIYSCPSAELAEENDRMVHDGIRICSIFEIYQFYNSQEALQPQERTCSYCKYAPQQRVMRELFTPTTHNAFA